ncbi:Serine/threonine-protein kinase ATG1a [Hondaea fermentalgiana]|uniref:Serine/threonine-protein kinase ATG1a n=1 Tax=Hondaea fermentalgiana TaxID=2315210 RepID=A0A2R5GJP3_9STRA|nr:Serine/threonine-protein kinase ATG1a [Hondaea fermentalgiana]|eukprot:GBG29958.1 Serine/threonine-protein kinase ATG1a [Hondaea fermentalgiana]
MQQDAVFELVGADGSPYSCKMRALLRYRRIPFRWVRTFGLMQGTDGDFWREKFPDLRAKVIPVLVRPDGTYGNDSTPLIQDLEQLVPDPQRSANPAHEGDRFLSQVLEDFADEWGTKVMFAGRFKSPEDATFGAAWQLWQSPEAAAAGIDPQVFAQRQRGRRDMVGALDWAPMEETLREICRILSDMVKSGQAFLFGDTPSAADFALYGQLRQTIQDPLPAKIMYEFPMAWAWVWRVDDLSGFEPRAEVASAHTRTSATPAVKALLSLAMANEVTPKDFEILDPVPAWPIPPGFCAMWACATSAPGPRGARSRHGLAAADRPDLVPELAASSDARADTASEKGVEARRDRAPTDGEETTALAANAGANSNAYVEEDAKNDANAGTSSKSSLQTQPPTTATSLTALQPEAQQTKSSLESGDDGAHGAEEKKYALVRDDPRLWPDQVAIKAISRAKLTKKLERNLQKEVSILQGLTHINIVALYETVETHRHIYLVMEYCAGGDLHALLRSTGPMPVDLARHIVGQLSEGMHFLWSQNLIHRDLKPHNLLLTERSIRGVLKIADFGFATHLEAAAMADTMCGSPLYMRYDSSADLWSAGTILFEMLIGTPPFRGGSPRQLLRNILRAPFRYPTEKRPCPQDCVDLLESLLRANPAERIGFEAFYNHPFLREGDPPNAESLVISMARSDSEDSELPDSADEVGDSDNDDNNDGNDDKGGAHGAANGRAGFARRTSPQGARDYASSTAGQHVMRTDSPGDEAWEIIPEIARRPSSLRKPTGAMEQTPSPKTTQAVQALRFAGELAKRVRSFVDIAQGLALAENGADRGIAAHLTMSHYRNMAAIALVLTVKALKLLTLALDATERAAGVSDQSLLRAARATRKDVRTLYAEIVTHGERFRSQARQGAAIDQVPSAESLMVEVALQLARVSTSDSFAVGDPRDSADSSPLAAKQAAGIALDTAVGLLELLLCDPSVSPADKSRAVGLKAVFLQRKRKLFS